MAHQSAGWPYRWYLVPSGVAALLWLTATAMYLWWDAPKAVAIAFAVAVLVAGSAWFAIDDRADWWWLTAAVGSAAGWLAAVTLFGGPWQPVASGVLAAGVLVFSLRWARLDTVRHRVRVDRDVRAWPAWAAKLNVPGAGLAGIEWTRYGRKFLIELAGAQTWRAIQPETAESLLRTRPGAVTIERDLGDAGRVIMHIQDGDAWATTGSIPHPVLTALPILEGNAPVAPGQGASRRERRRAAEAARQAEQAAEQWCPGAASVRDPIPIGGRPDGQIAAIPIWRQGNGALRWLVGGQTGAGKSVFYKGLITGLARCDDVVIWGIDTGKRGKVFGPWLPVMDRHPDGRPRVARNLAEAVAMLEDALDYIATSAEAAAREAEDGIGTDNVEPSRERPQVVILVDEAADLLDTSHISDMRSREAELRYRAVELMERIGAKGRSEAVSFVLATQRPDNASLGGSATLRSHCTINVCLRVRSQRDMAFVLEGDAASDLDTSLFRHAGLLYLQDGPDTVPLPIRSWFLDTPEDCRRVAEALAPGRPRIPDWLQPSKAPDATNPTTDQDSTDKPTSKELTMQHTPSNTPNDTPGDGFTGLDMPASPRDDAERTQARTRMGDVAAQIEQIKAEVDAANNLPEFPNIPLSELAAQHKPREVIRPGDPEAVTAIMAALRQAGDAGMTRAEVHAATGIDDLTVQRLLAALERGDRVHGEQGTGPAVRWRAAQHAADPIDATPDDTGQDDAASGTDH